MLRVILGLVAGVLVGGGVVYGGELAGHALWPPPAGMDPMDPDSVRAHMSQVPPQAMAAVAAAWGVAALIGGAVAALIARRGWPAWVVAAFLLAGALFNLYYIPSPIWMWVAGIGAIVLGGFAATKLVRPPTA